MCNAIRDGGNRCPKHRHDSIALVQLASEISGMTKAQTEDMFVQLRREGRNPEAVSQEDWDAALTKIDKAIESSDSSEKEALKARMVKARTHGHLPSRATVYAMGLLVERSKERGQNLENRLKEIAETSGFTTQEVKEKFAAEYAAVDRSRGAAVPEEYNQSSVRYATLANLPHDRSTVTALAKVEASTQPGPRRITRAPLPHRSSFIHEAGYDNGRLEISFKANPTTVYAYRDVPASVWDRMQEGSAGSIFSREVRGNTDYLYDNAEDAEKDAYTVRCSSCGQFAARTGHSCPQKKERERIETLTGVATPSIDEAVRLNPDAAREPETVVEDVSEVVAESSVEVAEEAPYVDPETVVDADADESDDAIATPAAVEEEPVVEEKSEPTEVEMLDDRNGLLTIAGPKNVYPDYVTTPQNQRDPQPLTMPEGAKIVKTVQMSRLTVINGSPNESYLTHNYYASSFLTEQDKKLIRDADKQVRFVVGMETGESRSAKILDTYDSEDYTCDLNQSYHHSYDEQGNAIPNESTYAFIRQPKQPEITTYTLEEKNKIVESLGEKLRAQVDSGEAVVITGNSTMSRKFKVDGSVTDVIPVRFGKATEFRRAIKDGKIAVVATEWALPYNYSHMDDQGYFAGRRGVTVSGEMSFKRQENGVMEVVSDENKLRCNCYDYQTKYNCHHVNYIQRHAGNVAQQTMPVERSHRLLTVALSGRPDVSVVEPKGGTPFIRFNSDHLTTARTHYSPSRYASIPSYLRPADPENPTHDEVLAIQESTRVMGSIQTIKLPPSMTQVRNAARRADVEMPVKVNLYDFQNPNTRERNASISGTFTLHNGEDGKIEITGHTLKCTCPDYAENYTCVHVRMLAEQHQLFLNTNVRNPDLQNSIDDFQRNHQTIWRDSTEITRYMRYNNITQDEALTRVIRAREEDERRRREYDERMRVENEQYEAMAARRREEREREREAERIRVAEQQSELAGEFNEYRQNRIKAWENVEEPYSENPAAFKKAMDEALERKKNGESAVVFKTENVTDGVCGDGPGTRAFGVELEFDIKRDVNRSVALRKIGEELYAAGLTNTSHQTYYHSAAENGYQKWSFEEDCTVDAELVSPIMKDTPEHWEELRKVIEIVERNGGVASTRAGSHVHVSSGSYQTKVAPHAELLRTFNQNEDIMYRLAADPKRGKHRGTSWCAPNTNDSEGEISKDDTRRIGILRQGDHALGLNFESAENNNWKKANVEFRLWDSTLDAGVIQQQVAMSVAMTDYAERKVETEGTSKKSKGERRRIGHGRKAENIIMEAHGVTKHNDETFAESHGEAAKFFDSMFRTKEQRDAAASLFALNKWQMR